MAIDIQKMTGGDIISGLKNKDFSSVEITKGYLSQIEKKDTDIGAYIEVFDDCLDQAREADRKRAEGDAGEFTGVPIALKDNILLEGQIASAGSDMLANYHATYTAGALERLGEEGVVFLGRTNMDEFAMGGSTENSARGVTKNPLDLTRVPGGSSGGSAAAVSGGMAPFALGSDTGGSIRQPASFCGLVGLKPTYGTVSRSGLMAMASSFDQIGPMTKTVTDAETLFHALRGHDAKDSTSLSQEKLESVYQEENSDQKKKYTIGVPEALLKEGMDADALESFRASLQKLEKAGHTVCEIDLPHMKYALSTYYIIMPAEVSSNLGRYDGVRYGLSAFGEGVEEGYKKTRQQGFGSEVRLRIMLGTFVLSAGYYDAYYRKAITGRERVKEDFQKAFEIVDVIATPTTPAPAFKIGEKMDDPLSMYKQDFFTVPANITGLPALSVPSGSVSRDGRELPVGLHLCAPSYREDILFGLGKGFLDEEDV